MIWDVPTLIAFVSRSITLEPGDVIATGTPAGVGHFHDPPRYLDAGDSWAARSRGSASLENPIVDELPRADDHATAAGVAELPTGPMRPPPHRRARCGPWPRRGRSRASSSSSGPVPTPGPGEVLLRIEAASDLRHRPATSSAWDAWAAREHQAPDHPRPRARRAGGRPPAPA